MKWLLPPTKAPRQLLQSLQPPQIPDHPSSHSRPCQHVIRQMFALPAPAAPAQLSPCFPGFAPGLLIALPSRYQRPATKGRTYSHSCNQARFGHFNIPSFNSLSWKPLKPGTDEAASTRFAPVLSLLGTAPGICGWMELGGPRRREPESDMAKKGTFPSGLVVGPKFCNPIDSSMSHPAKGCG